MGDRTRGRRPVAGMAAAVLLAVTAALSGCSDSGLITVRRCLPSPLEVTPAVASPGTVLTVSSGAAACDLGYREGHTYTVEVLMPMHRSPQTTIRVGTDGRFQAEVTVPADFPAGDAVVDVHGSPYDDCDDGGGSCAGYAAYFTIR
ncbi:hypothetical protein [Leifsonia sp. NPDC080035]|uniref:Lipoprotein n=1 Tax=Leifsonia sp. NPDC080035 TaxID=3143936 RepID=A0AAU7GBW6_9MICO